MAVYARSYTSGARDTSPSIPSVRTEAPEARVTTQDPVSTQDTSSESWMHWASDQLHDIAELESDWDSYGGEPPSPSAIAVASSLLRTVYASFGSLVSEQSQPQVISPRADGGIQVEWGTLPVEIAVHADSSGTLGYLYIDRQGNVPRYEEVQSASWDKILQLIAAVVFTVPR